MPNSKKGTAVDNTKSIVTTAVEGEPAVIEKSAEPATITIDVADAEQLYELFKNAEAADAHFHTCQSAQFRQHMQGVYKAAAVSKAYAKLKAAIDNAKGA